MKSVHCVFLSLIMCLVFSHAVQAKVCDEVLYLAYNGHYILTPEKRFADIGDGESIPYYFGVICIDSINTELTYYTRRDNPYLNEMTQRGIQYLSSAYYKLICLERWEEYTTMGKGQFTDRLPPFKAPRNTSLFSYWAGEDVRKYVGRVIRRDVNAEPELDWVPNFTDSRPFTGMLLNGPFPSLKWTDSKGRSGP